MDVTLTAGQIALNDRLCLYCSEGLSLVCFYSRHLCSYCIPVIANAVTVGTTKDSFS